METNFSALNLFRALGELPERQGVPGLLAAEVEESDSEDISQQAVRAPPTRLSGSNYTLYSQPLSDRLFRPAAPNGGPEQTANLNKEHAISSHKGVCMAQEAAWGTRGLQGCSSLGGRGPCTLAALSNMGTMQGQDCHPSAPLEFPVWASPLGTTPWEGIVPWWKEDRASL